MTIDPVAFARARIAEDRAVAEACREWLDTLPDAAASEVPPGVSVTATAGEDGQRTVRLPIRLRAADLPLVAFLVRFDVHRILLDIVAASALVEDHEPTEDGVCRTCIDPDPSLARPTPLRYPCPTLRAGLWPWSKDTGYDPAWDSLEP